MPNNIRSPIKNVTVASCTYLILRKSHQVPQSSDGPKLLMMQKTSWWLFIHMRNKGLTSVMHRKSS